MEKFIDRVIHKIELKTNKIFSPFRRKYLKDTSFSIISNNCWGGLLYLYFGLEFTSPTVGLYFFPEDYLKFVSNLKHYLSIDLEFIDIKESKHYEEYKQRGNDMAPIGKLEDVEICFLHYKTKEEALAKWNRRRERVNYDNLIIKFSEQNGATKEQIEQFCKLEFNKKFVFVSNKKNANKERIYFPGFEGKQVENDTTRWNRYISIYDLINAKGNKE